MSMEEAMASSNQVPEPMRTVLRDYLHVEWYELDELALDLRRMEWNDRFKAQLREAIVNDTLQTNLVEALTGQEFRNQSELKQWLIEIWTRIYGEPWSSPNVDHG